MKNREKRKIYMYTLLSLLLSCLLLNVNAAEAASTPTLSASTDSDSAVKGKNIDVRIALKNNPGISTLGMKLDYDNSILRYHGSAWNTSFSASDMMLVSDDGGTLNISVVCDNTYTKEGTVITVHFEAIENAATVPVTLELRDMSDSDLNEISNCGVSSKIKMPKVVSPEKSDADGVNTLDGKSDTVDMNEKVDLISKTASHTLDENYKTGAGLGNDIFLLLSVVFGVTALSIVGRKEIKRMK